MSPERGRGVDLLPNIVWHTLSGAHARHALGNARARRYAPGFSPIVGFADNAAPDFTSLAEVCPPGEPFYSDGWSGPAPPEWRIEAESTMFKMVWGGSSPPKDDAIEAVRLGSEHVGQVLELVELTHPGPFGPRTLELGDYFGWFAGSRLVAMAGERMHAGSLREISGVCTHPQWQGQGLAARLVQRLVRDQVLRGEQPFLHVMTDNRGARRLYERLGFAACAESVVRVIARSP